MRRFHTIVLISLFLPVTLLSAAPHRPRKGAAAGSERFDARVRVYNYGRASPSVLDQAEKEATQIFAIETSEEHVYTSAQATAEFVHRQKPNGTAFVIGEGGLLGALNGVGYATTKVAPDYVIVGEGRVLNYELVETAHRLIKGGAHLISTNADTWCPTDSGPRPGCGAIAALLESSTGRKAYHVGKPNPFMMRAARKRLGLRTDEVIMIGDTMETDIRGAAEVGFRSILVLTGSSTKETLKQNPFSPTWVVDSIAEVGREPVLYPGHKNIELDVPYRTV